jgi:hypothetical protein
MPQVTSPPSTASPQRRSQRGSQRRSVSLVMLVVVILAGASVLTRPAAPAAASSTTSTAPSATAAPTGVVSFAQAQKEGKVGSINWGSRCNVATGKLKYPSFFAGACYAPFHGNNGGATATGVTAKTIKVVYYVPQANDPILNYIEAAIKDTATNAQNIQTMQDWVAFYNHFY